MPGGRSPKRWLLLLFVIAGCARAGDANGTDPAPALVLIDSLELHDPASGPVGAVGELVPLPAGGYLVSDYQNARIVEYDAQGSAVRTIGKKGRGPGEFNFLGPMALDGDSVLYVYDNNRVHVLDFRTGAYRQTAALPAPFASSLAVKRGTLFFRGVDSTHAPVLSTWRNGSVQFGPALPSAAELAEVKTAGVQENARALNTTHSGAAFTVLDDDTLAVLSQSSENVLVVTSSGVVAEYPVAWQRIRTSCRKSRNWSTRRPFQPRSAGTARAISTR
jgi:hypothetical protein